MGDKSQQASVIIDFRQDCVWILNLQSAESSQDVFYWSIS